MHRPRPLWHSILFTMLFALLTGLAIGAPLLLDGIVPLENWLRQQALSQAEIDSVLTLVLLLSALCVFSATLIVHYLVQGKEQRRGLGIALLLISALLAARGLQQLSSRGGAVLARSAHFSLQEQRFNFGPYPDQLMLREITRAGVLRIITLLNPAIPFEATLLAQEQAAASRLGLTVHSLPMLPWVQGNEDQLEAALLLVDSLPGERFYVHCYLGKHRVALLQRRLVEQADLGWKDEPWPESFERGAILTFDGGRVVTGPQPTDEEWMELCTRQVKLVISLLDGSDPEQAERLTEAHRTAKVLGMEFSSFSATPGNEDAVTWLSLNLIESTDQKVYVFDFLAGKSVNDLRWELASSYATP